MSQDITRRKFLQTSMAATSALILVPSLALSQPLAKEDSQIGSLDSNILKLIQDKRFVDLMKLRVLEKPEPAYLNIYLNHNIYSLAHVLRDSSIEKVRTYFGKEIKKEFLKYSPVCEGEVMREVAWDTRVSIQYMKKFTDGLIQIAGFGSEWGTDLGTCWALYGNIVSTKEKSNQYLEPLIEDYEYIS